MGLWEGACLTHPQLWEPAWVRKGLGVGMGCLGAWQQHWACRLIQLSFSPALFLSLLPPPVFLLDPVLIVITAVARPSHHSEIRRLFPQVQMHTVPNAGHWVHSDNPQNFMDAISSFLA